MRKHRFLVFFIFSLILVAVILSTPIRSQGSWVVRTILGAPMAAFSRTGNTIAYFFSGFINISSMRQENLELSEKITRLEVDKSRIMELEEENAVLKRELGFTEQHKNEELVPARIIGREPASFLDYVVVDRGDNAGIKVNAPVIAGGALIGQVGEVYPASAKIHLITSKDSIIQAMLQSSRSKGILRGGLSGLMLENISQDVELSAGDYVTTSGLGGELPEGMLIGKARSVQSTSSSLYKNILVEPVADLSRLEIIFIVKQ